MVLTTFLSRVSTLSADVAWLGIMSFEVIPSENDHFASCFSRRRTVFSGLSDRLYSESVTEGPCNTLLDLWLPRDFSFSILAYQNHNETVIM